MAALQIQGLGGCDGRDVVVCDGGRAVCRVVGGKLVVTKRASPQKQETLRTEGRGVDRITASTDGSLLAFSEDRQNTTVFVAQPDGTVRASLNRGSNCLGCTSLRFSRDGKHLAVVETLPEPELVIWDWEQATVVATHRLPDCDESDPYRIEFSPTTWTRLFVYCPAQALVVNVKICQELAFIITSEVTFPAASNVSASSRRKPLEELLHLEDVLDAAGSPVPRAAAWLTSSQELYCACSGGELFRVDAETAAASLVFDGSRHGSEGCAALLELNDQLLSVGAQGTVRMLKATEGCKEAHSVSVGVSLSGGFAGSGSAVVFGPGGIFDVVDGGKQLATLSTGHSARVVGAVPCGARFATATEDGLVVCWDEAALVAGLVRMPHTISSVAGWPGASVVCCGSHDGRLTVVSCKDSKLSAVVSAWHESETVTACAFGAGGRFVFATFGTRLVVCDVACGLKPVAVVPFALPVQALCTHDLGDRVAVLALVGASADDAPHELWRCFVPADITPAHVSELPPLHLLSSVADATKLYTSASVLAAIALSEDSALAFAPDNKRLAIVPGALQKPGQVRWVPCQQLPGGGDVKVSSDGQHVISCGADGMVEIRSLQAPESVQRVASHSYRRDGAAHVALDAGCSHALVVGVDGTVATLSLNAAVFGQAQQSCQSRLNVLRTAALKNGLSKLSEDQRAPEEVFTATGPVENALDVTAADVLASESSASQQALVTKIAGLRKKLLGMIDANEKKPEDEQLTRDEFVLDLEEKQRAKEATQQAVNELQADIQNQIVAQQYLRYKIKKECWDSMESISKTVVGFDADLTVTSYSVRLRDKADLAELERVRFLRRVEMAQEQAEREELADQQAAAAAAEPAQDAAMAGSDPSGDAPGADALASNTAASGGSDAAADGGDGVQSMLYPPTGLFSAQRKRKQVILLADLVHELKAGFNAQFEDVLQAKADEAAKIQERNERIRKVAAELGTEAPQYTTRSHPMERPQHLLTVDDAEVKVTRVLTAEEQRAKEEAERLEAERLAEQMRDNPRLRGLDDMMHGRLEGKAEDDIWEDPPKPECMVEGVPKDQWSEEQSREVAVFEARMKELAELRDKRRKALEAELRTLQEAIQASVAAFDQRVEALFVSKLETERSIARHELSMVKLAFGFQQAVDLRARGGALHRKIQQLTKLRELGEPMVEEATQLVARCQEEHSTVAAADRMLDKGFKTHKDLADQDAFIDVLYKLFRKRIKKKGSEASIHADVLCPEGLDATVWSKFLKIRDQKIESEATVKTAAAALADAKAYLQFWRDRNSAIEARVASLQGSIEQLEEQEHRVALDADTVVEVKQGQSHLFHADFVDPDFSDALLLRRDVVTELNGGIQSLARARIDHMKRQMDMRKAIHMLQWEHKRLAMEKDDLLALYKDTQLFRVSRDMLSRDGSQSEAERHRREVYSLEKNIASCKTLHEKAVKDKKRQYAKYKKQLQSRLEENDQLDAELHGLETTVSERANVYKVQQLNDPDGGAEDRLRMVTNRRKLLDVVSGQHEEMAILQEELERLRLRTFPAFSRA